MESIKKIQGALISVYHKEGLENIIRLLHQFNVTLYSTGGTQSYIETLGIPCIAVESLTGYPSILGGRVKTLHPRIFGGILYQRQSPYDLEQVQQYEIPTIDLVIVDLYPFEKTLAHTANEVEIIEKIDIGGISLIRAAAKNFEDTLIVPASQYYPELEQLLQKNEGATSKADRKKFATYAFHVSSHYDTAIFNYFNDVQLSVEEQLPVYKSSIAQSSILRYGENPHQQGVFFGDLQSVFTQLQGKALSYNNLLDVDAALQLIFDFKEPTFAILKHNNACGLASRSGLADAWKDALAGDPVSAFGGVLVTNQIINAVTAELIHPLFFEVIIAPDYQPKALEILGSKKNRIILKWNGDFKYGQKQYRSVFNGMLQQSRDLHIEKENELKNVTAKNPTPTQLQDLLFANKIVKHTKSNAIVLAKNKQLLASGTGQTSRVDALKQAIAKAKEFNFDLNGAVMASDAFFPFPDCVEIAQQVGITAIIQPGGSIKDNDSIECCNKYGVAMVFTGIRHFKH